MSQKINKYILMYDIFADKKRTKVAKMLEKVSIRIQYSVFLIEAKEQEVFKICDDINHIVSNDGLIYCFEANKDPLFKSGKHLIIDNIY